MIIAGPAILEDPGTTIVIHPGNRASVDRFGNIHIDLGKGAAA
jgi:N-methylhydantoinase A